QGVAAELDNLPARYERIWLATVNDEAAGCVMYKRLSATTAEIKRLYVRPSGRGFEGFLVNLACPECLKCLLQLALWPNAWVALNRGLWKWSGLVSHVFSLTFDGAIGRDANCSQ